MHQIILDLFGSIPGISETAGALGRGEGSEQMADGAPEGLAGPAAA